ncbi:DUF982 domain-containing protein [Chelativorans sp. AA-79]|uniref:DUF982 domain-containing protein n=1 Tax=Chelativorans sp. AA-79 TaxID=3028735 RepID=UPI0023F87A4D|nr:DUF982 domain-containing protein [Chelativorans sp. AA-79]WEX09512.1 DUF982 domain-containing protein [Chelativorans sp. AA-79]
MNIGHWNEPVTVRLGRSGAMVDAIDSALAALQVLIHQWPVQGGPAHANACDICFAALDGTADPEAARLAFKEAAMEADILAE